MVQRSRLGAERVLVTGASGGVGPVAVQLAKRRGAHVTAVTNPAKMDALKSLGADEVLGRSYPLPENTFDVVLDLVGGPRWAALLDALVPPGRHVTSGAIAGPIVELDLRTLYLKDLTLIGSTRQDAGVFTDLIGYIERAEIRPFVAATYQLRNLRAAQRAFLKNLTWAKLASKSRMDQSEGVRSAPLEGLGTYLKVSTSSLAVSAPNRSLKLKGQCGICLRRSDLTGAAPSPVFLVRGIQ